MPSWDKPVTLEQLYDWPTVTGMLAEQAPSSEPGVVGAYHAVTQGFLIGEVVHRVTGRGFGRFFAEEVAGPLGADLHIGLAAEDDHRVAPIIPAPTRAPEVEARGSGNPPIPPEAANTEAWRRAEIPSANGFGNARSVAAVQSILGSGGQVRGIRLLLAAGCERALEEQFSGEDQILGTQDAVRHGLWPTGPDLFLGRLVRFNRSDRLRHPHDGVVCDEPDDRAGAVGRRPGPQHRDGRLPRALTGSARAS